ncbi:hypothetical protein LCGC14_1592800 [marine sediment metagenome]|uniref:Uncharacterized protein n=1 Tax=marine sediment metagenome TaxID=412755 RepID=A0A0F9IDY2_9ZZZZ
MGSCKTCKNFIAGRHIIRRAVPEDFGECRRGEPDTGDNPWPIIHQGDGCGEHQKRSNQ